jgi:predicted phosphodiesterase
MTMPPVAVLSDIHGNRWALEAVLDDISRRGIRDMVNLGDSLYGPLDPGGTAQIVSRS